MLRGRGSARGNPLTAMDSRAGIEAPRSRVKVPGICVPAAFAPGDSWRPVPLPGPSLSPKRAIC
jgi:hypothetical protein